MKNLLQESESFKNNMLKLLDNYSAELLQQYKYTGRLCINLKSGRKGIILRETDTGSIQVLESIEPKVITTHDNWNTLQILNEEDF